MISPNSAKQVSSSSNSGFPPSQKQKTKQEGMWAGSMKYSAAISNNVSNGLCGCYRVQEMGRKEGV